MDDFKLAGPKGCHKLIWDELKGAGLKIEDAGPLGHYLGMSQHIKTIQVPVDEGRKTVSVRVLENEAEGALKNCLERYKKLSAELGYSTELKPAKTPFKTTEQQRCPAREPCTSGPFGRCTHCAGTFSPDEFIGHTSPIHECP